MITTSIDDALTRLGSTAKFGLRPPYAGATEAVNFQYNNALATELVKAFSDAFEAIATHRGSMSAPSNAEEASLYHSGIANMIDKVLGPRLVSIINKYTNLKITHVNTVLPVSTGLAVSVMVQVLNPKHQLSSLVRLSTGTGNTKVSDTSAYKDYTDITAGLDREKARVLGTLKDIECAITIPVGIFILDELYGISSGAEFKTTPEEVTAILLHEIGHVFAWIEYLVDFSYVGHYGNNFIRSVNIEAANDPKAASKRLKGVLENISYPGSEKPNSIKNKLKDLLDALDEGDTDSYPYHVLLMILVYGGIITLSLFLNAMYWTQVFASDIQVLLAEYFQRKSNQSIGSRELAVRASSTMYERLADEFVSRFHMGKHLNTGLHKIIGFSEGMLRRGHIITPHMKFIKDSWVLSVLLWLVSSNNWITILICSDILHNTNGYEDITVRYRRNISNAADELKNFNLPRDIRNAALDNIEAMKQDIDKLKRPLLVRALVGLNKIFMRLPGVVIAKMLHMASDGSMSREYNDMHEYLEQLNSNGGFIVAAKLKTIFGK